MNSYEMVQVSQKLIQYLNTDLKEHGLYISITNTRGTIIACSLTDRIGKFCEPALQAISQKKNIELHPNDTTRYSTPY